MSQISNYTKICPVGAKLMNVDRRTDTIKHTGAVCDLCECTLKTMTNDIKMHTL